VNHICDYGIEVSDFKEAASSAHTAPNLLYNQALAPEPQTELPSRPKIDSSEVIFWEMEEELLANQAKTNVIYLALQYIMSKLDIDAECPREEPEVNYVFTKENEVPSLSSGQMRVKPAPPSDFNGD